MTPLTITVKQAAELTGASVKTLQRMIQKKELAAKKVRNMYYISMASLNQTFGGNTCK